MKLARTVPLAAVGAIALALVAAPARAQQFSAKAGALTLNLTIPEGVTKVRGLLAFTATGLGPRMAGDAAFAALAKRLSAGIVRVAGGNEFGDATYPTRCAKGEFKWMLDAIEALAKTSNHPEMAFAPIVGSGHSHGGDYWNYFNACYPERVALLFCKASGGVQYAKGALRTPMIWETGTNDLRDSRGVFRAAAISHRDLGTQMALVIGPGETHGGFTEGSRDTVIALIEGIFNLRVPQVVDASAAPIKLYDIDEKSGKYWLGDNYTKEVAPFGQFADKAALSRTTFLPNEEVAMKWKAYGANLPANVMLEKGRCSTCYKTPADEPEAPPFNYASVTPSPVEADAGAPPPSSTPDAGAPPATDPTPAVDASVPSPRPPASDPPASAPVPNPPGPKPSPMSPPANANPAGEISGGCAIGGGPNSGALSALLLLALVLVARRRQSMGARAAARD